MKSLSEGTLVLLPYRDRSEAQCRALGLVARRQPRGAVVALYVFSDVPPGLDDGGGASLPRPSDVLFRGRMSDHYIRTGAWPSLGVHSSFRRGDWPFDRVGHRDAISGRCKAVLLDDRNPLKIVDVVDEECAEVARLPGDTIYAPDWLVEDLLPGMSAAES